VPAWFAPTDELDAQSVVNALLAASPQALFVLDREHRIRGVNALGRARTRGAWQREVQLDDSMESYSAPQAKQGYLDAMAAALHGEHVRRERDIEYPSGASLRYRVDYTPVRANGGTGPVVGVVFGALDVTEQARARESRSLYAACMEQVAEGIVIADARAAELPIIYANPAFARITGYAIEEVIGRNCRFLQGAGRDQAAVSELRAAIRERRSTQVVLRNYRKDGTPFWNQLSISPVRGPLRDEDPGRRLLEHDGELPARVLQLRDERGLVTARLLGPRPRLVELLLVPVPLVHRDEHAVVNRAVRRAPRRDARDHGV
jgi:PAS domain S-box-containing protein